MDQLDSHNSTLDFQQNMIVEMMKQHVGNGLPFQYTTNHVDRMPQSNSDGEGSSHVEHEEDENDQMPMPVVYKKRARVKFTQEQLDALETTFEQHRYPSIDIVDDLVEQLNLPTQKITVWFQNRRARLKKSQQKLDDHPSFERDEPPQYDSGIHLDEDSSRASSISPSSNLFPPIPSPSPFYLANPHQTLYHPMWPNFPYTLQPAMRFPPHSSYDFANYHSPFVFHDMSNYQHQDEYHG